MRGTNLPSYVETVDDLNRKYARSYVLLNDYPVLIDMFDHQEETSEIYMQYIVDDKNKRNVKYNDIKIKEIFIQNGLYNIVHPQWEQALIAWSYKRRPLKQWKRGICNDNSELANATAIIAANYYGVPVYYVPKLVTTNTMKQLLNPEYPKTWSEALDICKLHRDVALNLEFGLMHSTILKEGLVIFNKNNHIVGEIEDNKIIVRFKPFEQEIRDMVISSGFKVEVICPTP